MVSTHALLGRGRVLSSTGNPSVNFMDIERLDRKPADAIGSNIVEKCDVTLSRAIQPLTSDVCAS